VLTDFRKKRWLLQHRFHPESNEKQTLLEKSRIIVALSRRQRFLALVSLEVWVLPRLVKQLFSSWPPPELHWLAKRIRPALPLHVASFLCFITGSILGLLNPFVLKWLIDRVIPGKSPLLLLAAVLLLFVGYQGRTALTTLGSYLMVSAAQTVGLNLRMDLLRHLDRLSADYYEKTSVGEIMYPLKEPVDEVSYFGSDLLPAILRTFLTGAFTLLAMLTLSPSLTLIVFPLLPMFILLRQYFRQRLTTRSDKMQADRLAWSDCLEEHLSSAIPIQLLGREKQQERHAFQKLARSVRSQQTLFRSSAWFTVGSALLIALSLCAVIAYGGSRALTGALTVGSLVAFYSFMAQLFEPLTGVADLYARAQKTFASIRQIQITLSLRASVHDVVCSGPLLPPDGATVNFCRVKFGYQRRKEVLDLPQLHILAGEQLAFMGKNGAGKSSLAKLIPRIYDADSGVISIASRDVRSIGLQELRRYVCYLSQDPVLFTGNILSNLRFVNPAASQEELEQALSAVGLLEFIETLPQGMQLPLGPRACQLSDGQRQRLAIARALLQRPKILIFDEATSCLDALSELTLIREIKKQLPLATLLMISHRITSVAVADRVVVLDNGHIIEDRSAQSFLDGPNSYTPLPENSPVSPCRGRL